MQTSNPALLPDPALFDVTTVSKAPVEGSIERVELDALELAPNARREISREGIERLAGMLMRTGQLVPCIGHRPGPAEPRTVIYDGQRRLLAAQASRELAGADGYEGLAPVQSLIVLLLDHGPSADEIRRIQAQANQRESPVAPRPAGAAARLLGSPRRATGGRPDRRRVRRPRDLAQARAQPPPPARAPRSDPHPRRRAPGRRADLGDDGQPPRRHARDRAAAHRGRCEADHDQ